MRAVVITRFGGPEVLAVAELPEPVPGRGEVRIRVAAATVNPTDLALREGRRRGGVEPPCIPGMELGGVVDAVGPGVATCHAGDRVMAIVLPARRAGGAQAELVVVPQGSVAPAPDAATLAQAATLPMNGLTARRALDLLDLPAGAILGVTGAAGAVGGYAVQLGKVAGLRVVADAGPADEDLVRRLGADLVVPRGAGAAAYRGAVPGGVDGMVDAAVLNDGILGAVRDGGGLATLRGFTGPTERGIAIHPVLVSDYAENREALLELGRLAQAGALTLRVARTYPPERAAEAHAALAAGGVRGRLVIAF